MKILLAISAILVSTLTAFATDKLLPGESSCYVLSIHADRVAINPGKWVALGSSGSYGNRVPWNVRDEATIYVVERMPRDLVARLVTGSHFYALIEDTGLTTDLVMTTGEVRSVRLYRFVRVSDHRQP